MIGYFIPEAEEWVTRAWVFSWLMGCRPLWYTAKIHWSVFKTPKAMWLGLVYGTQTYVLWFA